MGPIAVLMNLTKAYVKKTALDSINLQILGGEILALLGPNGSGKTTLLKILALIEKPSSGEVCFCNDPVADKNMEQTRMNVTMVFQKTTLFGTTVFDNVAYGLRIRKLQKDKIADKVHNALKLVKLEGLAKRQARTLSGGEQQRVALARALVLNTRLLLLDEPTANLDPTNAAIVEEAIATANRQRKTTVVMATHNMFQAKKIPHRIALMNNGRIDEVGTPTEIFGRLSKTLASFAALENTFRGNAKVAADGTTLVDIGNGVEIAATTQRTGQASVFISPEDIILSKSRFESSARNVLRGKIVEISDMDSVVRLKVDAGKTLTVQITKRSFIEMNLNLNTQVFLAFKASSVQIL